MKQILRLRGMNGDVKGNVWESDSFLRAGRQVTLEVVLDDSSVSRWHAEIRRVDGSWRIRDLTSSNGTYLNAVRLGKRECQLHDRDIIQFGRVAMLVEIGDPIKTPNGLSSGEFFIPDDLLMGVDRWGWKFTPDRVFEEQRSEARPGDARRPTRKPSLPSAKTVWGPSSSHVLSGVELEAALFNRQSCDQQQADCVVLAVESDEALRNPWGRIAWPSVDKVAISPLASTPKKPKPHSGRVSKSRLPMPSSKRRSVRWSLALYLAILAVYLICVLLILAGANCLARKHAAGTPSGDGAPQQLFPVQSESPDDRPAHSPLLGH